MAEEAVPDLVVEDLRPLPLFEGLDDAQLRALLDGGAVVAVEPGTDYFVEGEHADFWWVLVDGALDLVRRVGREESIVARMATPGQWAGGFRAWDDHGVYLATGRGSRGGRLFRVPAAVLRARMDGWFPFAGHLVEGLFVTARNVEANARQRGALVTLGTLAAGLAHEINNPASAATRATEGLGAACDTLLSSLRRLADDELTPQQFAALDELRGGLVPQLSTLDPLDRADAEQDVGGWLARHGVSDGWALAPALVAGGVDTDWCDRVAAAVGDEPLGAAVSWVASTLSARALLAEAGEATRRISELVAAVRSYSQLDRASMQRIDVTDGLESTLVMLGHKLRDGITVKRVYASDVPRIDAYAGELNQVWTNLIDNAIDAMDGTGTLRLETRADDGYVVVEIADTGTGMTPEVAARAFEAFYTTKDVGKGTGLGLDIAQRIIVDRHAGDIEIDVRPGETVLVVRLPTRA